MTAERKSSNCYYSVNGITNAGPKEITINDIIVIRKGWYWFWVSYQFCNNNNIATQNINIKTQKICTQQQQQQ